VADEWLKTIDNWLWVRWSTVTFISGILCTKVADYAFDRLKKRADSKTKELRSSLYRELSRNITQLQNTVDLRKQNLQSNPYALISKVIVDERYQAAKKSDVFYKLGLVEADVVDGCYKTFKRLGDMTEMLPLEASEQTIAHFFYQIQIGGLNRKVMKDVGTDFVKRKIKELEGRRWWQLKQHSAPAPREAPPQP
jgi:hypothetical protein